MKPNHFSTDHQPPKITTYGRRGHHARLTSYHSPPPLPATASEEPRYHRPRPLAGPIVAAPVTAVNGTMGTYCYALLQKNHRKRSSIFFRHRKASMHHNYFGLHFRSLPVELFFSQLRNCCSNKSDIVPRELGHSISLFTGDRKRRL